MADRPTTSIEGALYDLVARGKKDTYFIRDEDTSINLFDSRYESHPASIPELRTIVPRNRVQWGTTCEFDIEKAGDILIEPTILINLPSWIPANLVKYNSTNIIKSDSEIFTISIVSGNGGKSIGVLTNLNFDSIKFNINSILTSAVSLRSVFYNGTIWVSLGTLTNNITYSSDSINWYRATANIVESQIIIRNVKYNNNLWVGVGIGIFYSTDGKNWIKNPNASTNITNLLSIIYVLNYWLISGGTGGNGIIYYITDPTGSNISTLSGLFNRPPYIGWNGSNLLVAAGNTSNSANQIKYSTNGSNWFGASNISNNTNVFFNSLLPYTVEYGNGIWIVAGESSNIYSSRDGSNFSIIPNYNYTEYNNIKYINNSIWIGSAKNIIDSSTYLLISYDNCQTWSTSYIQQFPIIDINVFKIAPNLINIYGYVNGVAYFLFEKIQLYQDKVLLQEYSGDALFTQRHLRGTYNSAFLEDALTGVHDGSELAIQRAATTDGKQLRLRIPLPFCQHPDEGGFPLCAMESQQFRLRLTLRRLEDLVECSDPAQIGKPNPWNKNFIMTDYITTTTFKSLSRHEMGDPTLLLENRQLYIDVAVKKELSQSKEEYVATYSRLYENKFTFGPADYTPLATGTPAISKRLIEGRHPAEQIYWFFRSQDDLNANRLWKFEADSNVAAYYNNVKLMIAGREREDAWSPQVWQDIEAHAKQERYSGRSIGSMNWSYGVQHKKIHNVGGREINPTGTLNFTSADRPTVYVNLALPSGQQTSNTQMNLIVDGYGTYSVRNRRGGLLFAN